MGKNQSGKKPTRLLTVLTALVLVVALTADVLMFGVFPDSLDKAFPGSSTDQDEIDASYANGLSVAQTIEEEGAVLLENNGALPLSSSDRKINLLGYSSVNLVFGGTGSGGSSYTANRTDFVTAFTNAGFEVNENLVALYTSDDGDANTFSVDFAIQELPATEELAADMGVDYQYVGDCSFESMKEFSDIAVIVFSRKGGEGNDLPTIMTDYTSYAPDQSKHYLELNSAEQSLLEQAEATFETVIVLINSGNALELGFLEDEGVDAALWMGDPGDVGTVGIVNILTGEVNPSGRLADIYPYAVETIPSYYNFDTYEYTNSSDCFADFENHSAYLIEYQEGIYVGYRYYETREVYDYTSREGETLSGLTYDDVAQYPFGYGLSYTSFEWNVVSAPDANAITASDTLTYEIEVTNTGTVAGKDVVELYYTAPYYSSLTGGSGIQKSGVVLGGFVKTDLLEPGASQTVTIELPVEQMASYDDLRYYSANGSYVLEAGDYTISLRTDSHTVKDSNAFTYTLESTVVYDDESASTGVANCQYMGKRSTDQVTANNQFDDVAGDINYLNRETWEIVEGSSKEATAEQLEAFSNALVIDDSYIDDSDVAPTFGADNGLTIKDMTGLDYDDPQWDDLLDQLTLEDMYNMLGANGWGSAEATSVGKAQTYDMDGPSALSYVFDAFMGTCTYETVSYPAEVLLASSWNVDLAAEYGDAISTEAAAWNISGWYAPGANTHRNPFTGRNFEYYSEDGYLAGSMAANVVKAATSNGLYCYIKHFALNERETWRHYGLCTWASEQSMRELYLVPFEMAVKEGGTTAIMSSYNNLGTTWAGASTALLTNVLRNEWGFVGTVLTDNNEEHGFMDIEQAVLAGGTALLYGWGVKTFDNLSSNASGQLLMREAAHQYLYTVANSNVVDYVTPTALWRMPTIAASAALYLLGALGIVLIVKRKRYNKALASK